MCFGSSACGREKENYENVTGQGRRAGRSLSGERRPRPRVFGGEGAEGGACAAGDPAPGAETGGPPGPKDSETAPQGMQGHAPGQARLTLQL